MLAVRWLHVLGVALVLGGAVLAWSLLRQSDATSELAVRVGVAYERLFWAATGLLVMTGVGNLGSLAPYVPEPSSQWGSAFAAKLLVVLAVLVLSLVRTLVVYRYRRAEAVSKGGNDAEHGGRTDTLRVAYGATALALAGLVALGEVLAHG